MPYCPKCGEEVSEEMRFCSKCGSTLGPLPPRMRREKEEKREKHEKREMRTRETGKIREGGETRKEGVWLHWPADRRFNLARPIAVGFRAYLHTISPMNARNWGPILSIAVGIIILCIAFTRRRRLLREVLSPHSSQL